MDQCDEDSVALQLNGEQQEEEQQTSDRSALTTGSPDQMEQSTRGQEGDRGDEWDTDLETDDATNQKQSLSRAELYQQACRQTGAIPISSFLRDLSEANLNLNHYGVGPLGAKALAITLQNDSVVTNLELEDNALQAKGTHYLREMLQANSSIQSLNLSNNQLQLEGAVIISKMLSDNYYIKSIKLSGNDFDDSAAKYFADALKGDYVLKELDLSHNKFCDAGGEHLGQMLGGDGGGVTATERTAAKQQTTVPDHFNTTVCFLFQPTKPARNVGIEVLNLSWNHLRMSGVVALCAGLKVNSTLKQLHLSWNGFGHVEAESLGQALKRNSTLELLDISSNNIDDQAVTLLCQGLATNNTLKVLKLSLNTLTNIGALTLLRTVKNNMKSAMEEIDISTVFVCEAFRELLEEARQRRPNLNVRYSVMSSVTRNSSALQVFQKFLEEQNKSIMDFFQALDKEGTMKVSTSAFRRAVKAAKVPLDQRQLEWLMKKFDKNCTATITYSVVQTFVQVLAEKQRRTLGPTFPCDY